MAAVEPDESQIALLPKWCRVLFATRCARRLEKLMHTHVNVSPEFALAVGRAISEAELSAEYGVASDHLAKVSLVADAAHENAQDSDNIVPAMTAATACWVAKAAQFSEEVSASVAYGASSAAQRYGCSVDEIRKDYRLLLEMSVADDWPDDIPAPLDLLPPLEPIPKKNDSPF